MSAKQTSAVFCALALALIVAHAVALELAARTGGVSALLSPGPHSPLIGLATAAVLLSARIALYVVLPPLGLAFAGFLLGSALTRRRAGLRGSPRAATRPMLSGLFRPRSDDG